MKRHAERDERVERIQPVLLRGIVGGQGARGLQRRGQLFARRLVHAQELRVLGQGVAAPAGFRFDKGQTDRFEFFDDDVCMRHPGSVAVSLKRALVRTYAHPEQDRQSEGKPEDGLRVITHTHYRFLVRDRKFGEPQSSVTGRLERAVWQNRKVF